MEGSEGDGRRSRRRAPIDRRTLSELRDTHLLNRAAMVMVECDSGCVTESEPLQIEDEGTGSQSLVHEEDVLGDYDSAPGAGSLLPDLLGSWDTSRSSVCVTPSISREDSLPNQRSWQNILSPGAYSLELPPVSLSLYLRLISASPRKRPLLSFAARDGGMSVPWPTLLTQASDEQWDTIIRGYSCGKLVGRVQARGLLHEIADYVVFLMVSCLAGSCHAVHLQDLQQLGYSVREGQPFLSVHPEVQLWLYERVVSLLLALVPNLSARSDTLTQRSWYNFKRDGRLDWARRQKDTSPTSRRYGEMDLKLLLSSVGSHRSKDSRYPAIFPWVVPVLQHSVAGHDYCVHQAQQTLIMTRKTLIGVLREGIAENMCGPGRVYPTDGTGVRAVALVGKVRSMVGVVESWVTASPLLNAYHRYYQQLRESLGQEVSQQNMRSVSEASGTHMYRRSGLAWMRTSDMRTSDSVSPIYSPSPPLTGSLTPQQGSPELQKSRLRRGPERKVRARKPRRRKPRKRVGLRVGTYSEEDSSKGSTPKSPPPEGRMTRTVPVQRRRLRMHGSSSPLNQSTGRGSGPRLRRSPPYPPLSRLPRSSSLVSVQTALRRGGAPGRSSRRPRGLSDSSRSPVLSAGRSVLAAVLRSTLSPRLNDRNSSGGTGGTGGGTA